MLTIKFLFLDQKAVLVYNKYLSSFFLLPPAVVVRGYILHCITVIVVQLPRRLLPFVVAASPGVPPRLSGGDLLRGQEGGEAALQQVRVPADGMPGVAVVGTLAVEAEVTRRGDKECLQQVPVRQGVYIPVKLIQI